MSSFGSPTPMPLGPDENPNQWMVDVIRRIQGPALVLLAFGIFSVFLSLLCLIIYIATPDTMFRPIYDSMVKAQKDQPPQERKALPPYKNWLHEQQLYIVVLSILFLAGSFVVLIGAMKMRSVSGYRPVISRSIQTRFWALLASTLLAVSVISVSFGGILAAYTRRLCKAPR